MSVQRVHGFVQNYDWGKRGMSSAVAQLAAQASGGAGGIDEAKPYAEYWFGTHPSGPCSVQPLDGSAPMQPLQDYLLAHPEALGSSPPYAPSSALPYLFKILSVAKALSIQAHPDKARAPFLHANWPSQYKDDNHKPEMAVAVTPFQAMCGFREPGEILAFCKAIPSLAGLVGEEAIADLAAAIEEGSEDALRAAVKGVFSAYMAKGEEPEALGAATTALASFLAERGSSSSSSDASSPSDASFTPLDPFAVAERLVTDFPGDIGVFAPFLLNTLTLAPGSAVFLGANEPHAYLAGDCAEIMACSDNVVRAGLTPKWKHVEELVRMLTYTTGTPPVTRGSVLVGSSGAVTSAFAAPVSEFCLWATRLSTCGGEGRQHVLPPVPGAAILVATGADGATVGASVSGGAAFTIRAGDALLLPAGSALSLDGASAGGDLTLFTAIPGTQ